GLTGRDLLGPLRLALTGARRGVAMPYVIAAIERDDALARVERMAGRILRLRLYDSLTKRTEPVVPQDGRPLTVYSCGPPVYGFIHVGNARPFWIAMVLKRFCEQRLGQPVRLAINITDINDKIYAAAGKVGKRSDDLAREMAQAYIDDTSGLGLG